MNPKLSRELAIILYTPTFLSLSFGIIQDVLAYAEKFDSLDGLEPWLAELVNRARVGQGAYSDDDDSVKVGGAGSGNWGHVGRPGQRGGSAPGGGRSLRPTDSASRGTATVAEPPKPKKKPFKGDVSYALDYNPTALRNTTAGMAFFGITEDDVKDMCNWPGDEDVEATVTIHGNRDEISFETVWHSGSGEMVGEMQRQIKLVGGDDVPDDMKKVEVHHDLLEIQKAYQNRGIADSLYKTQFEVYRRTGVDQVTILADISIGKYAWARKGFQYEGAAQPERQTARFKQWCKDKHLELDSYPTFKTPQDVANFKVPGKRISSSRITSYDSIKPGDYELGKAFMLDDDTTHYGHGDWFAIFYLK